MNATSDLARARRTAIASVLASLALAIANITVGMQAHSRSVVALGLEFAGDVLASTAVLLGLWLAGRPPDDNHPYGHGRVETLAGLFVGFVLIAGGVSIAWRSVAADAFPIVPGAAAVWVLTGAIVVRSTMAAIKFRVGRRVDSTSLVADASNDAVDIVSALAALGAVALARVDPERFLRADHFGGVIVGSVVVLTGLRAVRDAAFELADTMPDAARTASLRRVAGSVPGVLGIEKHHARKTGLQYHVDLHVEVDPELTVRDSHEIAREVKRKLRADLPWVADVLVHIEPSPGSDRRPLSGRR